MALNDVDKSKKQLLDELAELRQGVAALESREVKPGRAAPGYVDTVLLNLPVGVAILDAPIAGGSLRPLAVV